MSDKAVLFSNQPDIVPERLDHIIQDIHPATDRDPFFVAIEHIDLVPGIFVRIFFLVQLDVWLLAGLQFLDPVDPEMREIAVILRLADQVSLVLIVHQIVRRKDIRFVSSFDQLLVDVVFQIREGNTFPVSDRFRKYLQIQEENKKALSTEGMEALKKLLK